MNDRKRWIPKDIRPSSIVFVCPYCDDTVYFCHGSNSKNRKNGIVKYCLYDFCPWCGKPVDWYIEEKENGQNAEKMGQSKTEI